MVLLVPASSFAAQPALHAQGDEMTAVMGITDVAPVSVPHRVRGRAWIAGWLTTVRAEEGTACAAADRRTAPRRRRQPTGRGCCFGWKSARHTSTTCGAPKPWSPTTSRPRRPILPPSLTAGEVPQAPHEAERLQHLAASHGEQVRGLCSLVGECGAACAAAGGDAVPLAVDRHGMRVRFWDVAEDGGESCFDVRFEFPEPVGDVARLRRAVRRLFVAAAR